LPTKLESPGPQSNNHSPHLKFMLGLLVSLESGGLVLGLGHYLAGHDSIKREIESHYGLIKSYFWGGEISLAASPEPLKSYFLKVNETCGLIHHLVKNSKSNGHDASKFKNSTRYLLQAVEGSCLDLLSEQPAPERLPWGLETEPHLHPSLKGINGNLRHEILNAFFILRSFDVNFIFQYPLHQDAKKLIMLLDKLFDLMDVEDIDQSLVSYLQKMHRRFLAEQAIAARQKKELTQAYSTLEKTFNGFEKKFSGFQLKNSFLE